MRKLGNIIVLAALTGGALVSCEMETVPLDTSDSRVLVEPTASIGIPRTRAGFSGPVEGISFPPGTSGIFGVTAYIDTHVPTSWVPTSRINFDPVNSDSRQVYHFAENKFYPREGQLYFYAYSPLVNCTYSAGTETEHPRLVYDITGQEDILWAKNESGIGAGNADAAQGQPDFLFTHMMQRFTFSLRRTDGVTANPVVSEIRISGLKTKAVLDIIDGTLDFEENPDKTALGIKYDFTLQKSFESYPYGLIIEAGIREFDLIVVMDDIEYTRHVTMSDDHAGEAGYMHELKITMDGAVIFLDEPEIVDWDSFETDGRI